MGLLERYHKVPLLQKLLVAMIIGVILGVIFGKSVTVIKPLGSIFLNLLKMAALPLIVVNLIAGISALDDPKVLGRIGIKIMLYYTFTTIAAIVIGMVVGNLFQPGVGFVLEGHYDKAIQKVPSLGQTLVNLIPSNIFDALAKGSFDKIVVFSAFVGITVLFLPRKEKDLIFTNVNALCALFNKMIGIIMGYAPIGICALMACTVGVYGKQLFGFLAKYLGASYTAVIVQILLYSVLLKILSGENPISFFKKASPMILTAMGTSSSLATVPVNLQCADKLSCSRSVSGFTIPLGSQINKDGNGMMLAITFLFAAQCVGMPLSLGVLIKAIAISLILTTGAGGVPGGGIVTIAIVINAFGLPLEIVGIVSGIFALIDMVYTMMNCLGDLVGTVIVDRSEANGNAVTRE